MRVLRAGAVGDVVSEQETRDRYAELSRLARAGHQTPDLSPEAVDAVIAQDRAGMHVKVVEFVDLEDGRRIFADCGLGYTSGPLRSFGLPPDALPPTLPHPWAVTSLEEVRRDIQFTIEADADDLVPWKEVDEDLTGRLGAQAAGVGAEWLRSRWARLIDAAAAEGIALTPAELEAAPFEVELTERLVAERDSHGI
jgi:hypothetical protein